VTELLKRPSSNAVQLYDFARVYAVASGSTADDKQSYTNRAMEMLTQAMKAGYMDAARMKTDPDLDPLRDRDDFKRLVADLEAKFPSKKETLPPPRADK
jgi:hypothetical protein